MCGITGFISPRNKSLTKDLVSMTSSLSHRGPDGQGTYTHEVEELVVGLGHRRLSIIDLSSAANQPMHYDGLHLIFNGEIYNFNEIRDALIAKGHQFNTHSDTEVILHSWREWGADAIHRWHGMFAIALWDEKLDEFVCIHDRAGVKPLHYYWKDELFIFGSELKSLTSHPYFKKEINPNAVASFL